MGRYNILLVDSELLSRDLLSNHLKHDGFRVFAVESCAKARKLISNNRFRLAIINSQFGEKDTRDLIARLRAYELDSLIFLLSPQAYNAESLAQMDIHETIIKPFRLEEVSVKLCHAVEIISLRKALRKSAERVRKLEEELTSFRSVEDEVKIPDLSEVELSREDSAQKFHEMKKEKFAGGEPIEQIRKLDDLRKTGILTEDEFNNKKKELLKRI
jgi:DNA-binding response OmpR family regulator